MDRQDVLKRLLYPKCKSAIEFKFDNLIVNPLLSYITVQDIAQLNKIATSLKYSSKPKEKYAMIDSIMTNRGFKKMASGTNRVTYRSLNDYRIVIKIAIDKVGLSDNGNEYRNQQLLKPFVTKCFEVSPCGTVGLFERVIPITSREEFVNISDDIFDLINNLIGKYVLEDIGEKFYMNYGLRDGFGPVLLDYPYVFELDGRKLICNVPEPMEPKGYCGGEIDYDIGYNDLRCRKCGKRYLATDLKSDAKSSDKAKIIIEGEDIIMRCVLKRGDEVVAKLNSQEPVSTNTIKPKKEFHNLKAKLSQREENAKKEYVRPEIKIRDDVQLRARLRGNRRNKDIDKEAIIKEEKLDRVSEKITVSFENVTPPEEPVKEETPTLKVLLSDRPKEVVEDKVEKSTDTRHINKPYTTDEKNVSYSLSGSKKINAVITYNGEIWNRDTNELVGYTVKETNRRVYEEFEKHTKPDSNNPEHKVDPTRAVTKEEHEKEKKRHEQESISSENIPSEDLKIYGKNESLGTTIGDLLGDKLAAFKGNGNYKTSDVTAPIENHFAKKEEPKEIPEVIIHPREEEYENSTYDEDYDPEYSSVDDDSEEEDLIGEY